MSSSHRMIFDIWHVRDIQYVLWLSLSVRSALSKVMILFHTAQKVKSSIKDLFSKCDQIRRTLRIWLHLLKESLIENFIFFAVPRFCASIQCPISLYQENIVYFLTRTIFPDSSPILGHLYNSLKNPSNKKTIKGHHFSTRSKIRKFWLSSYQLRDHLKFDTPISWHQGSLIPVCISQERSVIYTY